MKRLSSAIAAVLLVAHVPAAAADGASELDRNYLELQSASRSLSNMVACLINQRPDVARNLFDHEVGSPEHNEVARRFYADGGNCLWRAQMLQVRGLVGQGAVAEHLIVMDGVTGPIRPSAASSIQGGGKYAWTWRNLTPAATASALPLANCLLDRHPARVQELLTTRQVTRQEREVFNAMGAELSDCIPAGQTWTLQPQILRAAMATVYYKSARNAAGTTSDRAE